MLDLDLNHLSVVALETLLLQGNSTYAGSVMCRARVSNINNYSACYMW